MQWGVDRLNQDVCVIPLDELLWRIRMKHDPVTTKKLIGLK